ncbi:MAG TPA: hypothetical protein ENI81_09180 [Phycisphaerales bacterium]|nr:hypothetical protein [Phycisphaerales bacterium]
MIYEFAVEPALVASWHDRSAYRFFDGKFGLGTKRALCRFPGKRWRRLVLGEFQKFFTNPEDKAKKQAAKKRLDALIRHLEHGSTQRNHSWNQDSNWLDCALCEHARRPFQGIVVLQSPDGVDLPEYILDATTLSEEDMLWNPPARSTPREASELLTDITPLLHHVRNIRLIDPYFDCREDRWKNLLLGLLDIAQNGRAADESITVEIHTSVDREFDRNRVQDEESEREEAKLLVESIKNAVSSVLNGQTKFYVFVWSDRNYHTTEKLHNRWILTETGGILLGHGLDTPGKGTDDPSLLSKNQWEHRCSIYAKESSVFRLVRQEIISGET